MVAKEVFLSNYGTIFIPIRVQHESILVKKYWYSSQKKVMVKGWSRCRSRSQKKYLRLRGAALQFFDDAGTFRV
jgi:hypothetical protein